MPGVPDVYQGTEVWEDSLVDPDNRRPVDFARQRAVLAGLTGAPAVDDTGAAKLWVTAQALRARAEHPELFSGYRPLSADGPAAEHLVAYDRGGAITLATRLPIGLVQSGGWGDTTIELPNPVEDRLTGRRYSGAARVAEVLGDLPVALLLPA